MKTNIFKIGAFALFGLIALSSCKKEGCTDENALNYNEEADKDDGTCEYAKTGEVVLKFDHRWGGSHSSWSMNQEYTHPATQEKLTFQTLNYYISNVKLKKSDGSWWSENESYHLVKVDDNTVPEVKIKNVPNGGYTEIAYKVGVDSTRNVSGAQTGALDPSHGMFWNWNTGYIFIKAEGVSPDSQNGGFSYHLGGFQEPNNAIQNKTSAFGGSTLNVEGTIKEPQIHFYVNVARFWHGGISVDDVTTTHMPGENATTLANNFGDGFIVHHIH